MNDLKCLRIALKLVTPHGITELSQSIDFQSFHVFTYIYENKSIDKYLNIF